VRNGCVPNQISNNKIYGVTIGVQLNGCTKDTKVIFNKMYWTNSGHTAVLLTPFGECQPTDIEINYNYWGAPCSPNIGVENRGTVVPDARYNWWSAEDGPTSLDINNPNLDNVTGRPADGLVGRADYVIGPVRFDPWYGVDAYGEVRIISGRLIYYGGSDSFAYDETGYINGSITYHWYFGDGLESFVCSATHTYDEPDTYNIELKIKVLSYALDHDFVSGFLTDSWETEMVIP
jgi:hypothetical protein